MVQGGEILKLGGFFLILVVELAGLIAMANIPLVEDVVTSSGLSASEVWAGIIALLAVFDCMILVLSL